MKLQTVILAVALVTTIGPTASIRYISCKLATLLRKKALNLGFRTISTAISDTLPLNIHLNLKYCNYFVRIRYG